MGKSRYSRRHSRKMRSSRRMPFMFGGDNTGEASMTIAGVNRILPKTAMGTALSDAQVDTFKSIIEAASETDPAKKSDAIYNQIMDTVRDFNQPANVKSGLFTSSQEDIKNRDPIVIFVDKTGNVVIEKTGRIGDGTSRRTFVYENGKIASAPTAWFGGRKSRKASKSSRKTRSKRSRK